MAAKFDIMLLESLLDCVDACKRVVLGKGPGGERYSECSGILEEVGLSGLKGALMLSLAPLTPLPLDARESEEDLGMISVHNTCQ